MAHTQIEELEGSDLGTKDYWDDRYNMEIRQVGIDKLPKRNMLS